MGIVGVDAEEGAVGFATNTAVNPVNLDKKIKAEGMICHAGIARAN